jgi:hypothetical protein
MLHFKWIFHKFNAVNQQAESKNTGWTLLKQIRLIQKLKIKLQNDQVARLDNKFAKQSTY